MPILEAQRPTRLVTVTVTVIHPLVVGARVRVERDETRYPSRGTWPWFRGRTGTVVEINVDGKRPHLTEYGVIFGATRRRPDGSLHGAGAVTWFKGYEVRPTRVALAAQSLADESLGRTLVGRVMTRRLPRPKDLKWLDQYIQIGYTVVRNSHIQVRDPEGVLATSLSTTSSTDAGHRAAQAQLRRHERRRNTLPRGGGSAITTTTT